MTKTLISIDLDWLNSSRNPINQLKALLKYIPRNTPAVMTIEHHEFIPQLRRWIQSNKVLTPFNIVNIDEHHDYYYNGPPYDPDGSKINCGNWGYRLPLEWYEKYTWVRNSRSHNNDWYEAFAWLSDRGIKCCVRGRPRLSELKGDIVAAIFCVSPDYLTDIMFNGNMITTKAVDIIAKHLNLDNVPTRVSGTKSHNLDGWRIAPRPFKVS